MGFAPFGIGLLTLTVYACYAAGDDDRDQELQIEATPEYGPSPPLADISRQGGLVCGEIINALDRNKTLTAATR